jgi:flagellar motility protein MotE (MotC chaperone)
MAYDRGGKPVQPADDQDPDVPQARRPSASRVASRAGATMTPAGPSRASAGPPPARKIPLTARFRVLPVMIFLAALLLSIKVTAIWDTLQASNTLISLATYAEAKQAPAAAAASADKPVQVAQASSDKPATAAKSAKEKPLDPVLFTRSEIELLQELSKRRKELDAREDTIIQREGLLNAAETRIEKKIAELKGVKDDIELLIKKYDEQEEEQLDDLVAIYEKMKPKDASRIFNDLDIEILLQIFDKMKASKTALILAKMKADRAKEITSRIAARREMPSIN